MEDRAKIDGKRDGHLRRVPEQLVLVRNVLWRVAAGYQHSAIVQIDQPDLSDSQGQKDVALEVAVVDAGRTPGDFDGKPPARDRGPGGARPVGGRPNEDVGIEQERGRDFDLAGLVTRAGASSGR